MDRHRLADWRKCERDFCVEIRLRPRTRLHGLPDRAERIGKEFRGQEKPRLRAEREQFRLERGNPTFPSRRDEHTHRPDQHDAPAACRRTALRLVHEQQCPGLGQRQRDGFRFTCIELQDR